jgi:hypothetical protein
MSSARITIGGLDVRPRRAELVAGAPPTAEGHGAASVERPYDGRHVPVVLTVEGAPRPRCPLPPGPWRIISTLAVLGLFLSLVAVLSEYRRRAE